MESNGHDHAHAAKSKTASNQYRFRIPLAFEFGSDWCLGEDDRWCFGEPRTVRVVGTLDRPNRT